jgi:predicted TIM-barrel fold metal-dependent hydrolase
MALNLVPRELNRFYGEIIDVDSHEMMPTKAWIPEIGEITRDLVTAWESHREDSSKNPQHPNAQNYVADDRPVDEGLWKMKGPLAPGAVKPMRREAVMDAMGVKRQLMFPTGVGMYGIMLLRLPREYGYAPGLTGDRIAYGKALIDAYNEWGMRIPSTTTRVRPVLPLIGSSVDDLMAKMRRFIDAGIRAVWLPNTILPGGKSPASEALDPFWAMTAKANVTICLHGAVENQIFEERGWNDAEAFEGFKILEEIKLDPWSTSTQHLPPQNFVTTMVLGWVFERHPTLRFAVVETGAYWIGPLCDHMDLWYSQSANFGLPDNPYRRLPRKPSDYVKRNVRVSGFDFEPMDKYIKQYDLEDVLCFASDYPHVEGGKDPMGGWYNQLAPLGDKVVEKFFVQNGKWILPD